MGILVSINIPTYNAERTIENCLESIKRQTYKDIEIIVIDSDSKDRTKEIAQKAGAKIFYAPDLSSARRKGVLESQGKYIFLIDADHTMDSNVIEECVRECETKNVDAVTLFEENVVSHNTFFEKLLAYDKWVFHELEDDDVILGDAIPRFFKREVLLKIKWPEGLYALEHNLIYNQFVKQGGTTSFRKDLKIYHNDSINTLPKFFKNFYGHGKSYIPALKQAPEIVLSHSLPRRAYFSKKALSKPIYFLGLLFLYIVKGIAAGLGVISYFLKGKKTERGNV